MIIVDAHEDLAWNVLTFGRDYRQSVEETRRQEASTEIPEHNGQTLIGWHEWIRGRVAIVFSSLFAAPSRWKAGAWDSLCYEDTEQAHQHYRASLDVYTRWAEESPEMFRILKDVRSLEEHWTARR